MIDTLVALIGALVLVLLPTRARSQETTFRAGFARMSITPELPDTWTDANANSIYEPNKGDTFTDGNGNAVFDAYWLAGFHQGRPAQSVHDPIYAIAAVLDDGETRLAVVVLDAIGFFYDDVADMRARLPEDWGIDHAIIASTHSHEVPDLLGLWGPNYTTPGVNADYKTFVKRQIVAAIGEAVEGLRPAEMRLHHIDIPDHELVADSRRPEVIDPGIRVMHFVDPAGGATLGSILSWASHPETTWSRNLAITPDFPGYFRDGVADGLRYGDQIAREGVGGIHLYINGAIGGLMTTPPDLAVYDPFLDEFFGEPTHEKARAQGYRLADAVLTAFAEGHGLVDPSPKIRVFKETLTIPLANEGLVAAAQAGIVQRAVADDSTMASEVNLVTLGEAWIATIPGEIYPEIVNGGIETPSGADYPVEPVEVPPIRAMMQGRVNFIFGLANDELGYIIPKSEWDEAPPYLYDADSSPYGEIVSPGPETGPIIHAAVARLIDQAAASSPLHEALTFYASFDGQPDAAFALGDPKIYTAPSWDEWADGLPGIPEAGAAAWIEGEGRFGDALWIDHVEDPILFFKAEQNVAYQSENWSGTVSFWLRLDPDEDLIPNSFSDPILITSKDWDDAALFVDFTRESPRHFRLAAFADTKVWNPSGQNWWELPDGAMPMITIADPPFARDAWTHVVMTFDHFNTGRTDGVLTAYLNGQRVGDLTGREQTFTWDPAQTLIKIGIQYAGYVDDLAFFNRALTDDEVKSLYDLANGVAGVLR